MTLNKAVQTKAEQMKAAELQRFQAGEMPDRSLCECGHVIPTAHLDYHRQASPLHRP